MMHGLAQIISEVPVVENGKEQKFEFPISHFLFIVPLKYILRNIRFEEQNDYILRTIYFHMNNQYVNNQNLGIHCLTAYL